MADKKLPDFRAGHLSEAANSWFHMFQKILDQALAESAERLPPDSGPPEYRQAALEAVRLTLLDSGMDDDQVRVLFRAVATNVLPQAEVPTPDSLGYPSNYFEATEGSFADEPLECPPELSSEERDQW